MVLSFRQLSAEYSAEYSVKSGRIFGIGRYQFWLYRSFTTNFKIKSNAGKSEQFSKFLSGEFFSTERFDQKIITKF